MTTVPFSGKIPIEITVSGTKRSVTLIQVSMHNLLLTFYHRDTYLTFDIVMPCINDQGDRSNSTWCKGCNVGGVSCHLCSF